MSLAVDKTSEGQTVPYGEKWGNFARILSNKSVHTHIDNSFWLELYSTPNFGKMLSQIMAETLSDTLLANINITFGQNIAKQNFGSHLYIFSQHLTEQNFG